MGRIQGRRHKLRYEVLTVQEKCLGQHLNRLVRESYSVCAAEAPVLVEACLEYAATLSEDRRGPFDVLVQVPIGREILQKVSLDRAESAEVVLSLLSEDDAAVWLEQGVRAMQTARMIRLIEQADRAGCTMPSILLGGLVALSSRTVVERLHPLLPDLRLPLLGVKASLRSSLTRLARVLHWHVLDRPAAEVQRDLVLSAAGHGRLLRQAADLLRRYESGATSEDLVETLGLSPSEVDSTLEVLRVAEGNQRTLSVVRSLMDVEAGDSVAQSISVGTPAERRSRFEARLIRRHSFSPARAELLRAKVEEAWREWTSPGRESGEVVFWAIRDDEPAGKRRVDCAVVAAKLPYFDPDEDIMRRGTVGDLKIRRAQRLATAARAQSGLLSLPDLAFLVGMGTTSLQQALSRTQTLLPTRGRVIDIGPGVTHRAEVIRLYVEGYTEAQIVRRTHHTYDSVGAYVTDFERVMVLHDRGLPAEHIRKVLKMSRPLVDAYLELYREVDVPVNQWKLNLMRRGAETREKKLRRTR